MRSRALRKRRGGQAAAGRGMSIGDSRLCSDLWRWRAERAQPHHLNWHRQRKAEISLKDASRFNAHISSIAPYARFIFQQKTQAPVRRKTGWHQQKQAFLDHKADSIKAEK